MAISLTPETQARLQERAARSGQDASALAETVLTAYLDDRVEVIPPAIVSIADDDSAAMEAVIATGDADFAAGRFSSLDAWRTAKQEHFGISV
jgi:predicted transcriptional regulator